MAKKKEMTPEDKMMKAIYGKDWKTEAEIEEEIEKVAVSVTDEDYKKMTGYDINDVTSDSMLFVRAMRRRDVLWPMVERITARKYFPNENYRKVFIWSLLQAAQWQYEQIFSKNEHEDFEEEFAKVLAERKNILPKNSNFSELDMYRVALHFSGWKKRQIMNTAIEGEVQKFSYDPKIVGEKITVYSIKREIPLDLGDKVKIIKTEEK